MCIILAPTNVSGFDHQNIIAEYQVSAENPNIADPNSERIIMSINQPEFNHCGGQLAFGPDGYLYIGVGDGGGEGDPSGVIGNGQNINTSLGKILRIDVDHGNPYSVPPIIPLSVWMVRMKSMLMGSVIHFVFRLT